MGFSINTNLASLNAVRRMSSSSNGLNRTFERLASGLRVNGSRDDAAGLAISNRLTAQIRGMSMAIRNTNDGISMAQIAEGALDETTNALQRMRELAIQAASGSLGNTDRLTLDLEVQQLVSEIQRISTTTTFNGVKLIDGHLALGTSATFQVGANVGETLKLSIGSAGGIALSIVNTYVSTATAASHALSQIDNGLDAVSDIRANLGAYQNRFESIIANLGNVVESSSAARSRIMDADIAAETTNLTKFSILQQAGVAILAQANQQPQIALRLLQ